MAVFGDPLVVWMDGCEIAQLKYEWELGGKFSCFWRLLSILLYWYIFTIIITVSIGLLKLARYRYLYQ